MTQQVMFMMMMMMTVMARQGFDPERPLRFHNTPG
jgi:hypothetical protein